MSFEHFDPESPSPSERPSNPPEPPFIGSGTEDVPDSAFPAERDPSAIEALIQGASAGDRRATDALLELVYGDLRALAAHALANERPGHTLQPTALAHEVYLRLVEQTRVRWQSKGHFMAIAATAMRRLVLNHARDRRRRKRGGDWRRTTLEDGIEAFEEHLDVESLELALQELETVDARKVRIVEMRFFLGLTVEQTAELMDLSPVTVKRDWEFARVWLLRAMTRGEDATP